MLKEMYKEQRYTDVIAAFKENSFYKSVNEWDYLYYMNSLYKLERYNDCLNCYLEFERKFKDSNLLNDAMGRALYQLHFKDIEHVKANVEDILKKAVYAIKKCSDDERSPKSKIFKKVLEFLQGKENETKTDWFWIKSFLGRIDPNCLSKKEKEYFLKDKGKTIAVASDEECWYSGMTKALLSLEEYEECIKVCDNGLSSLGKFHYNNDIWFNYRKAKCLLSLNKVDEAAIIVEKILKSGFSSEYLLMLMFQIEATRDNFDAAMMYATKSSLFNKVHEKRLKFYEEFASFLEQNDYKEEAMLHRRLIILVRQENKWRIKSEQENWYFDDDLQQLSKAEILKKLVCFWEANKNKGRILLKGKVTKLLGEGKSGFITSDNGGNYYFNVKDFLRNNVKVAEGAAVEFFEESRFDKSKNKMSKVAVEIKII